MERLISTEYALYLPNTDEWIIETMDENIWLKGERDNRFTSNYEDANRVLNKIAIEKHLVAHIDIIVVEVKEIVRERKFQYAICPSCEEYHLVEDMQYGVIDLETGKELLCIDCYESADLIVGNQPLDCEVE